jgi:hypothetical protein
MTAGANVAAEEHLLLLLPLLALLTVHDLDVGANRERDVRMLRVFLLSLIALL